MVRPERLPEDRRTNVLRIRLTYCERAYLDAAVQGKTSTWARRVLLSAARREIRRMSNGNAARAKRTERSRSG